MQRMSEEVFKKFLVFLASNLDENKELLMLVQKRYDECNNTFRISANFQALINDVQSKIEIEKHRIFVHLKDFLSKLKSQRVESSEKKRKQDGFCNNLAKRLCTGNSCSDISSDSDFFKKVKRNSNKKYLNDLSSVKSDSPNDVDASNSSFSSTVKKTEENSKMGMGKSSDKPWPISDEESLSLDSVRSETKSSDNSDLPLYLNSKFSQEPESVSIDSVSSESKCSRLTSSPSTSKLSLNLKTNTPLPKSLSENSKSATELSQDHVSEAVPETHVVIDDEVSCSDHSLPSETQVPSITETKNTVTLEKAESIENMEGQKRKKGSERQIKRLEKLLGDIRDEIENATKKELSMEDMEQDDSSYVYEDRLQKKFVKVWEKLCELKSQDTSTGRPIEKKFRFNGTRYTEVNKRIEKFINKKKIFPDYNDVKKIVTQVNSHYNLYLGRSAIDDLAREAFTDVGNQLQDRRHKNFIFTFGNSQTEVCSIAEDPALYDTELRKKLEENRKLAKTRLDEVISKYAKKQYETNAQPEEVDDDALDSSSEEEEDETQDIPELDEVMALSDGDDDEVSEIPGKTSANLGMPLTKNLKIKIEKLTVPPAILIEKKSVPSSTSSCHSTTASPQDVKQNDTLTTAAIPNTGLKQLSPHKSANLNTAKKSTTSLCKSQDCKTASNEIVIDLDSSSDADDSTEVIPSTHLGMQTALVPLRTQFPTSTANSSNSAMTSTHPSSSPGNMVMSSQNSMQFSMQVKTQYQQQQSQESFSLKIASVASLAYSIKDSNSNRQYFTSQQTNYQNQGFHLTSGNNYKQISNKPSLPAPPSNSVIVLSDSD